MSHKHFLYMLYSRRDYCRNLCFWRTNISSVLCLTTFRQLFRFLSWTGVICAWVHGNPYVKQRQALRSAKSCDCYFPLNTCVCVCGRVHACANNVKANTYAKYLRWNGRVWRIRSYIMREFLTRNVLRFCLFKWVNVFRGAVMNQE